MTISIQPKIPPPGGGGKGGNIPLYVFKMKRETFLKGFCSLLHPHPTTLPKQPSFLSVSAGGGGGGGARLIREKVGFRCKHQSTPPAKKTPTKKQPWKQICHSSFRNHNAGWVTKTLIQLNYPGSFKNFTVILWIIIKLNFKSFSTFSKLKHYNYTGEQHDKCFKRTFKY